ncbi:haloacid dehalogenase-like hydrolase [Schlesneria sp.]|uniref:haloacid dehalogenase-like hydrolase n=1 Tax=Schlesneria sp. TaxID=2762018 RepID=UPI002F214757
MRIGIDFDNTLVCYDQLFWKLASEQGLVDESVPPRKNAVRDHLRRRGLEERWTQLQGLAYGSRILEADPFPGMLAALKELHERGAELVLISHKTRTPIAGSPVDLHAAAQSWLLQKGLWNPNSEQSLFQDVYFELTKEEKLQRIAYAGCDWFIDDLIELLTEPRFPVGVQRVLFDPHTEQSQLPSGILRLKAWNDATSLFPCTEKS